MTRTRTAVFGLVVFWFVCLEPVLAISPSYVMVYGGARSSPLLVRVSHEDPTSFLWETRARRDGAIDRGSLATRLNGRRFVKFAVFWGRWNEMPTDAKAASQHGRLYLPTATEPAVVVVTGPVMEDVGASHPAARPIPEDLNGFLGAWALTADELALARSLLELPAQ